MPDHIDPIPTVQGQADWPAMLRDLEKRVETLSDALEGVKLSMRRLVLAEPWLEEAITTHAAEQPAHPAYMSPPVLDVEQPLSIYEPPAPFAGYEPPAPVVDYEPVAAYEAPEPVVAYEAPEPFAGYEVPEPVVESDPTPAVEYDEDAREAVRRAVEDAKAQMATGDWLDEPADYVDEAKPEVSWITMPDDGSEPEPLPNIEDYATPEPVAEEEDPREAVRRAIEEAKAELAYGMTDEAPEAAVEDEASREAVRRAVEEAQDELAYGMTDEAPKAAVEDEASREAVRRAVEEAKAEMAYGMTDEAPEPAVEDEEASREAVRRAVEEAKAEMAYGMTDEVAEAAIEDEEASREAVRRAVEEAKAELAYGVTEEEPEAAVEDEEASREAVRRAVEEAKAEMGFAPTPYAASATPAEDEEAAREAVRQAVAEARAEMANNERSPLSALMEGPKAVEKSPAFVVPPPHRPERIHPPTITIEDPEGRVELAAVYNLLKHLDCAANSSLLNYSSRQVSVQLSDSHVPEGENVAEAVRDVFERENDVQVEGLNVMVKLGANYIRAA